MKSTRAARHAIVQLLLSRSSESKPARQQPQNQLFARRWSVSPSASLSLLCLTSGEPSESRGGGGRAGERRASP